MALSHLKEKLDNILTDMMITDIRSQVYHIQADLSQSFPLSGAQFPHHQKMHKASLGCDISF